MCRKCLCTRVARCGAAPVAASSVLALAPAGLLASCLRPPQLISGAQQCGSATGLLAEAAGRRLGPCCQ
jgi:hypothetical protein